MQDDAVTPEAAAAHAGKKARIKQARDRMMAEKTREKGADPCADRAGQGQKLVRLWDDPALHRAWHALRRGAVQQGRHGDRRTGTHFGHLCRFHTMGEGFTWETQDLARDKAAAQAGWEMMKSLIRDPANRMVLLDEINIALRYDYLDVAEVVDFLPAEKPQMTHVVVTGRNARPELLEIDRDGRGQAPVPRRDQGPGGVEF